MFAAMAYQVPQLPTWGPDPRFGYHWCRACSLYRLWVDIITNSVIQRLEYTAPAAPILLLTTSSVLLFLSFVNKTPETLELLHLG